jgi:hypothetical protein
MVKRLLASSIAIIVVLSLAGCAKTDEGIDRKALAPVRKIAADVAIAPVFQLRGGLAFPDRSFSGFTRTFPELASKLTEGNAAALEQARQAAQETVLITRVGWVSASPMDTMSSEEFEQLVRDAANDPARRAVLERYLKGTDLSSDARKVSSIANVDAALFIEVEYEGSKSTFGGKVVDPKFTWRGQLFDRSGRVIWRGSSEQTVSGGEAFGSWDETESPPDMFDKSTLTSTLKLDGEKMASLNRAAATEPASRLVQSLVKDILAARATRDGH